MASVVTTSGTYDLEMSVLGTELPQEKSLDLRNVITALCCNSESALSFIPTGLKSNVYFVCKNSGLDIDFADDCSWATGSSIHRSLYVCLPNNALKRVSYKEKLYVFPQSSGGQKTLIPLDPQPSHEDILEIHTRNFCHSESSDYKKRVTWISKLPVRIWPVLPKTACIEYLGTSPEVPSSENESYQYVVQEEVGEVQDGPFFEPGNTVDLEQSHVKTISESNDLKNCEGPANGNFIDSNLSCDGLIYDIPVLNLEDVESCAPQDLPYEPVYIDGSVEPEKLATQPLYFYVSPNCSTNFISSLIPVDRVADREKLGSDFELCDSQTCETDLLQLYTDISAKHKENIGSKCSSGDKSSSLIKDSKNGTPLPFGKCLDLKNIIHALQSSNPIIKIPRGLKKDAYYIVKKSEEDECGRPLSKCYADEFAWVGCHEKSETFCCKENNEFERLSFGKNVTRSTEDEILIVRRSYGSAKAPFSLQKRITSITKAPSYLHPSISQVVCVEYVGNLDGPIRDEETDSLPFSVEYDSCGVEGGNFLPLKSTFICGIPLPEGNFLDIESLLAALVSGKSVSSIPNGTKEDVYFVCNESSNLFCRETGEISPTLDEFGRWYTSHSVIVTFVVYENGSHERCYLEDDFYYRRKRRGDRVIYELFDPQPSSGNILEINRNHASSLGLWRRITWVIRAPRFLCSVVPNCACVEYLGSHGNGFLTDICEHDAVDKGQDEDELECLEGSPLPEGKFMSPRLLLQAMRSVKVVEQIPAGLKSNVYFIIEIERVKDLRADKDWCSGSEVTHEMYYESPESTSCVRIFKKRGFYCAKKGIPLLPQPTPESILEIDRHTSTWRESTLYRRQISWITKVPSHVAPLATNLACVEYVVDSGASLEFVDDQGEGTVANKQRLDSSKKVLTEVGIEKDDIMQLHSFLSINDTDSLSSDVSIPISDVIKRSFVRNVVYDEKGEVNSLILYTDEQIMDLCRFCCSRSHCSVLGVKTLIKEHGFNVTVLTYTNYSVIHVPSGKHPLFIGPIFIHKGENECVYNLFLLHMKDTFSKTYGTVRGGKKYPWVWGSDISRTLQQSLAFVYRNNGRLVCVEDVKKQVHEMVMNYLSESSVSKGRLLQLFAGPEGLCSSRNEEELDSRISMIKLMGKAPSNLLQQFTKKICPILKKNFITHRRHPWIEPLWVNGSKSIRLELLRAVSKSFDLIHAKGSKSEENNSNLGALINNLYGYVKKQVTELFSVLTKESDVLILSKEFEMHKINKQFGSFQKKKPLLEKFWVFLGARNYDGKCRPSKKMENNVVKNTMDPDLVVQQRKMTGRISNEKLIPLGKSKKGNVSPCTSKMLQIGEKITSDSIRYKIQDKRMKGVNDLSVKRNAPLLSVDKIKAKRCRGKSKTVKERNTDMESSSTQESLVGERFHAGHSFIEIFDENDAHENGIANGKKSFVCSPYSKGKKTSGERLIQQKITPDKNLKHNTQVPMPLYEATGNSFGGYIEKPQASKKRKRSDQMFEPITSMPNHDSSFGKHNENDKGLQGKFLEKKESVSFVDDNSNCCPERFLTKDSVVEVMEPNLEIQRKNIARKVRGNKSKFVNGNLLNEQERKITEVSSGDSNCIPGQIVESCTNVENSKVLQHSVLKVESKSGKSVKHKKKASLVSGKLGGKCVVKCLKGQQRRFPHKNAAQTKTLAKKPRNNLNKLKCNPNLLGKQDKKGFEMQYKESRKQKISFDSQVISDKSQQLIKEELGLSNSSEVKYIYKEESCLKRVAVRLEVLPQKTLKTLSEEGSVLLPAK